MESPTGWGWWFFCEGGVGSSAGQMSLIDDFAQQATPRRSWGGEGSVSAQDAGWFLGDHLDALGAGVVLIHWHNCTFCAHARIFTAPNEEILLLRPSWFKPR